MQLSCAEMEAELAGGGPALKAELAKVGARLAEAREVLQGRDATIALLEAQLSSERRNPRMSREPPAPLVTQAASSSSVSSSEARELRKQVEGLTRETSVLKAEMSTAEASIEKAFADLGLTRQLNQTLGDRVKELVTSCDRTRREREQLGMRLQVSTACPSRLPRRLTPPLLAASPLRSSPPPWALHRSP